jgi:hypothetical protein
MQNVCFGARAMAVAFPLVSAVAAAAVRHANQHKLR